MNRQNVIIKSFPNGISISLNPDLPFEELLVAIEKKFIESAAFFKNANLAISFENRVLTSDEETRILDVLVSSCNINPLCIVEKNSEDDDLFTRAIQNTISEEHNSCIVYKGNITERTHMKWDRGVVILGDVYPDAVVEAKGSIIVIGGLYGEAYAGTDWKEERFVIAMEMAPSMLAVGRLSYQPEKKSKWSIITKVVPKIAYVKDGRIVLDVISKEAIAHLPFEI